MSVAVLLLIASLNNKLELSPIEIGFMYLRNFCSFKKEHYQYVSIFYLNR